LNIITSMIASRIAKLILPVFGNIGTEFKFIFLAFRVLIVVLVGGVQFNETGEFGLAVLVVLMVEVVQVVLNVFGFGVCGKIV
jgi:hypothetical protein